ncbi:hypothetical protein QUF88_04310 [Bacillus sp. DX1.1]|nr:MULTISPECIES: hypothetical protein [unclassified Bacillus (in: firmicutes)]MDM5153115.1 hypothetical protein [Bacillus sp. DX1.1]WJE84209.1 hypothetical protein QRE67_01835 [Bacillus sp. DX3.1]
MKRYRYEENPLITPNDISPYHEGFEVMVSFRAGVVDILTYY